MTPSLRGLYAVTPDEPDSARLLQRCATVLGGGARLLQYRNKAAGPELRREQVTALLTLCRHHRVPLIVNDDPQLAADSGADGVHLGGDDGDPAAARQLLGGAAIIGVSCYDSLQRARDAAAAGADYAAFGSMFASARKPRAPRAPLALFAAARELPLARCGIGGITLAAAPALLAAGADLLAVIGDLFDADDPAGQARRYTDLFAGQR